METAYNAATEKSKAIPYECRGYRENEERITNHKELYRLAGWKEE